MNAADRSPGPDPGFRRILIIFNPTAGWRRRRKLRRTVDALRSLGCECEILETTARGDAERFAREAAHRSGLDAVAVAGGDGTINEVVNGLAGSSMPLGIIPMGTANVLACEIGQRLSPAAIARTLAVGETRLIRPGRVNGRRFILMTGVGMDAWVITHLNPALKKWIGKLAYGWAMAGMIVSPFRRRYQVVIDGRPCETGTMLIANARCYGGPFVLAPKARLTHPSFQVVLLEKTRLWDLLRYSLALARGKVGEAAHVRSLEAGSLEVAAVRGDATEWVQSDGDLIAQLPIVISVDPEPLWLIVPHEAAHV